MAEYEKMETFSCPELDVQMVHLRDVLRMSINTILFLRSFNGDVPFASETCFSSVLGMSYLKLKDSGMDDVIDEKVKSCVEVFECDTSCRRVLVYVTFSAPPRATSSSSVRRSLWERLTTPASSAENVAIEKWVIPVNLIGTSDSPRESMSVIGRDSPRSSRHGEDPQKASVLMDNERVEASVLRKLRGFLIHVAQQSCKTLGGFAQLAKEQPAEKGQIQPSNAVQPRNNKPFFDAEVRVEKDLSGSGSVKYSIAGSPYSRGDSVASSQGSISIASHHATPPATQNTSQWSPKALSSAIKSIPYIT